MARRRVKPPIREFADRGMQWLLDSPLSLRGLMTIVRPDLADQLSFAGAERLPGRHIRDDLSKQERDLLFRVPLRLPDGDAAPVIPIHLLLEHQSTADRTIGVRAVIYMAGAWEQQIRAFKQQRVPKSDWMFQPTIPVVIYTGEEPWKLPLAMPYPDNAPQGLRPFQIQPEILLLDLKATSPEKLVEGGEPFGWILRVIQKEHAPRQEFEAELELAMEQLRALARSDRDEWERALWYFYLLVTHRRSRQEGAVLVAKIQAEMRRFGSSREATNMIKTWAEEVRDEGREEGIRLGSIRARQDSLLGVAAEKFGRLPETVEVKVRAIDDVANLDRLLKRVIHASSLEEMGFQD